MWGTHGHELAFALGCLHLPGDECARGTAAPAPWAWQRELPQGVCALTQRCQRAPRAQGRVPAQHKLTLLFFPPANALAVRLQQVTLPLVSQSQCMQYWGSSITSSMLCAGGVGASSCQVRSWISEDSGAGVPGEPEIEHPGWLGRVRSEVPGPWQQQDGGTARWGPFLSAG